MVVSLKNPFKSEIKISFRIPPRNEIVIKDKTFLQIKKKLPAICVNTIKRRLKSFYHIMFYS